MEICKLFLRLPAMGYGTRIYLKRFANKIRYCQRALSHSHKVLKIIKSKILEPLLWVAETEVLAESADMNPDMVTFETAKYLEACQVEGWKIKAQIMVDMRKFLWRGMPLPPWREAKYRAATTETSKGQGRAAAGPDTVGPGPGGRPIRVSPKRSPAAAAATAARKDPTTANSGSGGGGGSGNAAGGGGSAAVGRARARQPPKRLETMMLKPEVEQLSPRSVASRLATPQAARMPPETRTSPPASAKTPIAGFTMLNTLTPKLEIGIENIERYRLPVEEKLELARTICRESVEIWWRAYQVYKISRADSARMWITWRSTLADLQLEGIDRELWPEPPPVIQVPEELLSFEPRTIKHKVLLRLRARARDGQLGRLRL